MNQKQQELIIDPKDFHVFLKARMFGDSMAEFAAKLGISTTLLYMLLAGTRKPSAAILKKVGLEVCYRAVLPAPVKGKKQ